MDFVRWERARFYPFSRSLRHKNLGLNSARLNEKFMQNSAKFQRNLRRGNLKIMLLRHFSGDLKTWILGQNCKNLEQISRRNLKFGKAKNFSQNFTPNKRKFIAIIGLGANMKDEKFSFKKLFRILLNDKRFKLLKSSSLLVNKAFGYTLQKDFTNAILILKSLLHARILLKTMLFYEFKFRRQRSFKNAPRVLDLDILYFSAKTKNDKFCTLAHPGANERLSVILPLGEILER